MSASGHTACRSESVQKTEREVDVTNTFLGRSPGTTMDASPLGSAPLDPDLADLLAGYRRVLRFSDERLLAGVRVGDGRWLRHVRVLVSTAFLRPIVAAHADHTVAELSRALHYEAVAGGADRAAALDSLEHFRQSLPVVPMRRYTVWFLGAALA